MPLEDALIQRLSHIIERSGASIVTSSTWRLTAECYDKLIKKCGELGMDRSVFIGQTPEIAPVKIRDSNGHVNYHLMGVLGRINEIKAYVTSKNYAEQVVRWIVIDDMDMGGQDATIAERVVKTEIEAGLTDASVELAVNLLTR